MVYVDDIIAVSEFMAMKLCIEEARGLGYKLRMFGVLIQDEATHILCDNESVVKIVLTWSCY